MCGEIRLVVAEVRRRNPLAGLRGTSGGRCSGLSSMGPQQALLLLLFLLLLLLLHYPLPTTHYPLRTTHY